MHHASPFALLLALAVLPATSPVAAQSAAFDIPDGDVTGLVAAINAANGTIEADTINLAPGGTYTLTAVDNTDYFFGPSGLPKITSPIAFNGNGATVERSGAPETPEFRIFAIAGGQATFRELTIRGGRAAPGAPGYEGGGGGLRNDGGTLLLVDCTVADNSGSSTGSNGGGGIFNFYGGLLTVTNSTITHNTGYGARTGGGILNMSTGGNPPTLLSKTTIINCTILENRADGPDVFKGRGDALADNNSPPGSIVVKNSILASPTLGFGNDLYVWDASVLTSLGHNIVGDASASLAGTGDLNDADPLLGPLANNGGLTSTHEPLPGSPAIDAVPLEFCTDSDGNAIATDQRGYARPEGPACDAGSVEFAGCQTFGACLSMVGHWPMEKVDATDPLHVVDVVNGNNGVLMNGAALTYGPHGTTLLLDGIDDYVEVPDSDSINIGASTAEAGSGDFTLAAWIRTSQATGNAMILDKRQELSGPVAGYAMTVYNGRPLMQLASDDFWRSYVSTAFVADGEWHCVVVTVDRDQPDGIHFFVDGVMVVDPPMNPTIVSGSLTNSFPLRIGRRSDSVGDLFTGNIDEVAVTARALCADEVQALCDGVCSPVPAWQDVCSGGPAGIAGIPQLEGLGSLMPGSPNALSLTQAAGSASGWLLVAINPLPPVPFKGGTLCAFPYALLLPFTTAGDGSRLLPFMWPAAPGLSITYQAIIQDAAALPGGFALSNSVRGTAP